MENCRSPGIYAEFFDVLFRQLNISYTLTVIADSYEWGDYNASSDTFDGLTRDLEDGVRMLLSDYCFCLSLLL